MTQSEYHALKKNLYRDYPGTYKTDSKGEDGTVYIFHNCKYFNRYGVCIRLMKCCFVDQKDRTPYDDDDRKKANRYNKHYLRFACRTHELVIYDKTYQIEENQLDVSYEKLPNGLIRFEMHCQREYLRRLEKKLDYSDTSGLLKALVQHSREELTRKFSKCFPDVSYHQADVLQERIRVSHFLVFSVCAGRDRSCPLRHFQLQIAKTLSTL